VNAIRTLFNIGGDGRLDNALQP